MKTNTQTLARAMDILARDIQSQDGIANAAIREAAERLRELDAEIGKKIASEKLARTLFVYAKAGKLKCLSPLEASAADLPRHGWAHTATLDSAIWIEFLANSSADPSDALDGLQFQTDKKP
jgi:hypothetical protein